MCLAGSRSQNLDHDQSLDLGQDPDQNLTPNHDLDHDRSQDLV